MMTSQATNMNSAKNGVDILLEEIHLLRLYLNELSREVDDLSHPRLVKVSQLLDEKLNFYHQLKSC